MKKSGAKRWWLNSNKDSVASVGVNWNINNYTPTLDCQIQIVDCHRQIHIDFDVGGGTSIQERRKKVAILEAAIAEVKKALDVAELVAVGDRKKGE